MFNEKIYEVYLSSGCVEGHFSIIDKDEKLQYHLELWENYGDSSVGVDFYEGLSMKLVVEVRNNLQRFVNDTEFEPIVFSFGRLEINFLDCYKLQFVAYLEERDEYDELCNSLKVVLDIANAQELLKLFDQVLNHKEKKTDILRHEMAEEIKWYCEQLGMDLPQGYPDEMSNKEMEDWLECWHEFDPIKTF